MRRYAITDAYMRPFENLRISVTVECNYRCIFCHIEGEPIGEPVRPGTLPPLMKPDDIGIVARAAWLLGARAFKITGGEPLVRGDIVEIVDEIARSAPGAEISMTTNGYLLSRYASRLSEAGLKRVNVSVHSLRREVYRFITNVDGLDKALQGLEAARDSGLGLKINMVVLAGVNTGEVWELARFAREKGAILQLIELHPVGLGARFFRKYFYPLSRIEEELVSRGAVARRRKLHNRPLYELPDGSIIEIVRPYANPLFCQGCTRIRLGPFGDLSPCLNWRGPRPNIMEYIRRGTTYEEKVYYAAEALVTVNRMRRPTFLPGLGGDGALPHRSRLSRMGLPKKRADDEVLRGLRLLLLGR